MIAMRTHMEGLKKMVAVRGGFEKLRLSNPAAAAIAFWFVAASFLFAHVFQDAV